MKHLLALIAAAGLAVPGISQAVKKSAEPCLRICTSFDLVVHASYAATAPLFGPNGERAWAGKHWDPAFVYPLPAHDVEGAVFTVSHGPFSAPGVGRIAMLADPQGAGFSVITLEQPV